MAQFFQRGATPQGGRDGTPFNNGYQLATALQRVQQARATAPYARFKPDPMAAPTSREVVSPQTATSLDNHNERQGAAPVIKNAGKQTKDAERKALDSPLPPGLRPAALRARGLGPTAPGELGGVTIGGRPIGGQVGYTGHAAPERPLAMSIPRAAATHLPPRARF